MSIEHNDSERERGRIMRGLDRIVQLASTVTNIASLVAATGSITLFGLHVFNAVDIDVSFPVFESAENDNGPTASTTTDPRPTTIPMAIQTPSTTIAPETTLPPTTTSTTITSLAPNPTELVDDSPKLSYSGDTGAWCIPVLHASDTGHDGDFWFTWAKGQNEDGHDARAEWNFKSLDGSYLVEAWIPSEWATATASYNIFADVNGNAEFEAAEILATRSLDQAAVSEWQSLGVHKFSGDARVEIDNATTPNDYREDGTVAARIAVDAIRLTLVASDEGATTTTETSGAGTNN